MILYHGSNIIIKEPKYKGSKPYNDYGYGFYCTKEYELASEWAAKKDEKTAYVNTYNLDLTNLKVLDLSKYDILNWLAILLENRKFAITSEISKSAKEFVHNNYYIDISNYDVIIGYRADDSYFSFAEDFLNNTISLEKLERAMKLGELGIQYVLISKKSIDKIKFLEAKLIDVNFYHTKYYCRDAKARKDYSEMKNNNILEGTYILDLMRRG